MRTEKVMSPEFFVLLVFTMCAVGHLEWSLNKLKNQAVKRGHAEWYATTEGNQPTQWRWKETSGDE